MKVLEYKIVKNDLTTVLGVVYSDDNKYYFVENPKYREIKFDNAGNIRPIKNHLKYKTIPIKEIKSISDKKVENMNKLFE